MSTILPADSQPSNVDDGDMSTTVRQGSLSSAGPDDASTVVRPRRSLSLGEGTVSSTAPVYTPAARAASPLTLGLGCAAAVLEDMFPGHVVTKLRKGEPVPPESFRQVSVLFADLVGYTEVCHQISPMEAHKLLEQFYCVLDYGLSLFPQLYKVETIGDCLMVIGGAPKYLSDATIEIVRFALLIPALVSRLVVNPVTKGFMSVRVGIHTGDVVAGVVGFYMPRYSLSGDAINTASRMQALATNNSITMSITMALQVARAAALASRSRMAKMLIAELNSVLEGRSVLNCIEAGREVTLGDITLVSCGLQNVKGIGKMQTFILQQSATSAFAAAFASASFLDSGPTPVSAPAPTQRVAPVSKLGIVEEVAALVKQPLVQAILNVSLQTCAVQGATGDTLRSSSDDCDSDASPGSGTIARNNSDRDLGRFPSLPGGRPLSRSNSEGSYNTISDSSSFSATAAGTDSLEPLTAAALAVLDDLEIIILCDASTMGQELYLALKPVNPSWTVRIVSTCDDVVRELKVGHFRCDLLLLDPSNATFDVASVLDTLKEKFPQFMQSVVTILMQRESACEAVRELETARIDGVDDCWPRPLPEPIVLQTRLLQKLVLKLLEKYAMIRVRSSEQLCDMVDTDPAWHERESDGSSDTNGTSCFLSTSSKSYPSEHNFSEYSIESEQATHGRLVGVVMQHLRQTLLSPHGERLQMESSPVDLPLSVFVVEDSTAQRKLIVKMLQRVSPLWTIVPCLDADDAVQKLHSCDFECHMLFVDENLGSQSAVGSSLVRELRDQPKMAKTVVVGLSRDISGKDDLFFRSGADAAWSKPLPTAPTVENRLKLLWRVRHVLVGLAMQQAQGRDDDM